MRELADAAPALVWMTDAAGKWTFLGALRDRFRDAGPTYLEHWLEFVHPDDLAAVRDTLARARADGTDFQIEHRVVRSDGTVRWMLSLGAPRFAKNGSFRGYGGATIDISAKHDALAQLEASEARYRLLADESPVLISHCDADAVYTYASPSYRRVLGIDPKELIGADAYARVHPDDHAALRAEVQRQLRAHGGYPDSSPVEVRLRHRDGHYVWTSVKVRILRDARTGAKAGSVVVARDITRERAAREAQRFSEERFRSLTELSSDGYWELDAAGRITRVSGGLIQLYGARREALVGRFRDEFAVDPADPQVRAYRDAIQARERFRNICFASRFADEGRVCYISLSGEPTYLDGVFTGFRGVGRDVTAERELQRRLSQLADSNRAMIENSPDALIVFDGSGGICRVEGAAAAVLGYEPDELIGRNFLDFSVADAGRAALGPMAQMPAGVDELARRVTCWRRADGAPVYLAWAVRRSLEQDGVLYATARDVTEVHRARIELHQLNQQLVATLESIGDAFFAIDRQWRLTYANMKAVRFVQRERDEVVGKLLWEAVPEILGSSVFPRYQQAMQSGESTFFEDYYEPAAAWVEVRAYPHAEGMSVYFHDITERKHAVDQLEYLATHDVLTGLPNRVASGRHLQQLLDTDPADAAVAVMFVDLDRFKLVNDSLGHLVGDALLQQVAGRLRQALGQDGMITRFGGDEFVVTARCTDVAQPSALAAKLQEALAAPFQIEGEDLFIGASIGIALSAPDARSQSTLYQNANSALFRAKAAGRNQYRFFAPEMTAAARERMALEGALWRALERGELALQYQPQVDLCSGRVVGVEALLRWQHPEWGFVAPDRFIAVAEESGAIVPIGAWVLRTACQQAAAWRASGLGPLRVAVNLSARQFAKPDLVQTVAAVLADTGLPADALDLELTESTVIADLERTVAVLAGLKELGVQLSVDDFGTGYSSLAHLKRFPLDVLKIDRSFVQEICQDSSDSAIPDAIIAMAHSLGIRVIAEGVETEEQCAVLARKMCDEIQGFLFATPLPAHEVETLVRSARTLPPHLLRMHRRAPTLLLVDDEPNILSTLRRLLRSSGCQILTAGSGQEGLELLAARQVDVIVSDQRMPGMTGVEFLRTVKRLYPDTVRIVLSGYTELDAVTSAVNEGAIYKFLTKPWDDAQLRAHIADALAHKQMADENRRLNMEVLAANQGLAAANRRLEEVLWHQRQHLPRDGAGGDGADLPQALHD